MLLHDETTQCGCTEYNNNNLQAEFPLIFLFMIFFRKILIKWEISHTDKLKRCIHSIIHIASSMQTFFGLVTQSYRTRPLFTVLNPIVGLRSAG